LEAEVNKFSILVDFNQWPYLKFLKSAGLKKDNTNTTNSFESTDTAQCFWSN
jgi:hypothetical protein